MAGGNLAAIRVVVAGYAEPLSPEFLVVGQAQSSADAAELAARLRPDVVLIDLDMAEFEGLRATERIREERSAAVILVSAQGAPESLRLAMKAGASDYLVKPVAPAVLAAAVREAAGRGAGQPGHRGKVVTVWGARGGVGKSTVAINLAAGLAQRSGARVAAVDLDLEFGGLSILAGVEPRADISDLCRLEATITASHVERVLARQPQCGFGLLAAPPLPHLASAVDGQDRAVPGRSYVGEILEALRESHDYVVVDTAPGFREANLTALDRADLILMVTVPEVMALAATTRGIDVLLERLEYPRERLQVVLNRSDSTAELSPGEIEAILGVKMDHLLPYDSGLAIAAANAGLPLVLRRLRNRPLVAGFRRLVSQVAGDGGAPAPTADGGLSRLLGLLKR